MSLALSACSKSDGEKPKGPSPADLPPMEITFGGLMGFEFEVFGNRGEISRPDHTIKIEVPAGATATFDGRPLKIEGTTIKTKPLLGDSLAEMPLQQLVDDAPKATMILAFQRADGRRAEGKVTFDTYETKADVIRTLRALPQAPLVFKGESTAPHPPKTLFELHVDAMGNHFQPPLGGATKMSEVDLIAIDDETIHEVNCPYPYYDRAGNKYDINRNLFDESIVVYDRRTGKVVASQKFEAKVPKCAKKTTGDFAGTVDQKAVAAWLQSQLAS